MMLGTSDMHLCVGCRHDAKGPRKRRPKRALRIRRLREFRRMVWVVCQHGTSLRTSRRCPCLQTTPTARRPATSSGGGGHLSKATRVSQERTMVRLLNAIRDRRGRQNRRSSFTPLHPTPLPNRAWLAADRDSNRSCLVCDRQRDESGSKFR